MPASPTTRDIAASRSVAGASNPFGTWRSAARAESGRSAGSSSSGIFDPQRQILVQWRAEATEADRIQALARSGGQQTRLIHTASMKAEGEGLLEVIQLPEGEPVEVGLALYNQLHLVRFAERDQILQPQVISNDPGYANGSLWGMYSADSPLSIGLPATTNVFGSQSEMAWDAGYIGSKSVYVGVLDEGFDYTHPDLSANAWVNPYEVVDGLDNDGNGYIDDIRGWDFNGNDNTTYDGLEDEHGTHVAGTIGAVGGNGLGVAGVNWSVSMISVKFLGTNGGTLTGAIMAMDYLTDLKRRHGLNIVASNNSWGGLTSYSKALQDATVRAAKQDILFIAAAGNTGGNNDISPSYPSNTDTSTQAGYDSVVAVTALASTGEQSFSYGSSTVDLAAPGVGIFSTMPGGGYGTMSGTSMATPHVTGAVALYAAKYPNVSARQIREALLASTTPTASLAGRTATGGRLDVNALLNVVAPSEFSISSSQAYLTEGQNGTTPFSFLISRKGSTSGQATVSWAVSGLGSTPADGTDFADLQLPTGTVSFSPGEISKTVIIDVLADSLNESSEAFAVTLSSPTQGATLGTTTASSIILNDDGVVTGLNSSWITIPPSGSANPYPSSITIATESDVSLLSLDLTLHHLSHLSPDDLDVLLVGPTGAKSILMSDTGGGNGVNDISLTFSSLASQSLPDTSSLVSGTYRPTDFQIGDLFPSPTAPVGPYVADLSIFNGTNPNGIWSLYVQDDSPAVSPFYNGYLATGWSLSLTTGPSISLSVSPASVPEDGTSNLIYTFTRTGSTSSPLIVNYSVAGTATLGTDYTGIPASPATKSITFAAGSTSATLSVDPNADTSVEPDETVALTLAAGSGYTIGTPAAVVGTIINDDVVIPPPSGAWSYNWANASPLGNIPSILKASLALPSPRAGEQPLALTALRIDLHDPAIQLTSTGRRSDWANNTIETTSETSRQYISRVRSSGVPIVAAINTAPFDLNPANQFLSVPTNIRGFAVSEGQLVSSTDHNGDIFKSTFLYDPVTGARIENKASTLPAPGGVTYPAPAAEVALASTLKVATSGFGIVLNNGVVSGDQVTQNARSALGLTAGGRYLTMLTVDRVAKLGPPFSWQGATDYDVGTILRGFGSSMGINMDGGSSTQLAWWNPTSNQAELLSNPLFERYVGASLGVLYQPI